MKPRLLDLFSGAGGCSVGYHRAGFDVVGVDINPQPNYPYPFVQHDAMAVVANLARDGHALGRTFDAVHASPPCQMYSRALKHLSAPQPMLIDPVRDLLDATGLPWVIENVPGAPIPTQPTLDGRSGIEICGTQFGMRIGRHRLFESNVSLVPPQTACRCDSMYVMNPHNQVGRDRIYAEFGKQNPDPIWNAEMGVPWMSKHEGREAVPPAYTELIGHQLMQYVRVAA